MPPENQDKSTYSNTLKWVAAILAELIILIGVFALGMNVGFRKAHFTDEWIKNYPANFGSQAGAYPLPLPPPDRLFNNHGVLGTILNTDGKTIIIKAADNNENTVILEPATVIRQDFTDLTAKDLKANQQIIVIGAPNEQGQIDAKFIRILNGQQ